MLFKRELDRTEAWRRLSGRFGIMLPPVERGGTLAWGRFYLPHYFRSAPSLMHRGILNTLDKHFPRRGMKAAYIGPRGGAKSTSVTLTYVLKSAVEGSEQFIILDSDTEGQAVDHLAAIKGELEDNQQLAIDYPHACGEGPVWKENYIKLNNGVVIFAVGTGSRIRGRRVRQHRPTLIVLDDPENDGHTESENQRNKTERWLNRTLLNMGDENTNFVCLGSAMHRDGLLMRLISRPGFKTRRVDGKPTPYRSIEQWPKRMDLWDKWEKRYSNPSNPHASRDAHKFYKLNKKAMLRGAVLSWPDKDTLYGLMKLRAEIGHSAFDAEKQGNPIDPATCEWPERYFTHDEFYFDEWPEDLVVKGMALDPSKGKTDKKYDYSAIAMGGLGKDGVVYIDLDMDKRPTDCIVTDTVELYQSFSPTKIAIETNQFQSLLAEDISEAAEAAGIAMSILPMENFTAKTVRIRRLSTLLSQRRIRFRANSEGAAIAVQQLRDFPNADHDDGPDAVEMVCRLMFGLLEDEQADEFDKTLTKIMDSYK